MKENVTNKFKILLYKDTERAVYFKLEAAFISLCRAAQEMVAFIDTLKKRTNAFSALQQSYRDFLLLALTDLHQGIDAIKEQVLSINFYIPNSKRMIMNQGEIVRFFEKQNHFNAEANSLVKLAMGTEGLSD